MHLCVKKISIVCRMSHGTTWGRIRQNRGFTSSGYDLLTQLGEMTSFFFFSPLFLSRPHKWPTFSSSHRYQATEAFLYKKEYMHSWNINKRPSRAVFLSVRPEIKAVMFACIYLVCRNTVFYHDPLTDSLNSHWKRRLLGNLSHLFTKHNSSRVFFLLSHHTALLYNIYQSFYNL